MTEENNDHSAFFLETDWTPANYGEWANRVHKSRETRENFDDLLKAALEADREPLPLAMGLMMAGRFSEALAAFSRAGSSKVGHFFAGRAADAIGRSEEALSELAKAKAAGWDAFEIEMESAVVHVRANDCSTARKLTDRHASAGADRAVWHFVDGMIHEYSGNYIEALEAYERSLSLDPDDPRTMFRCAYLYDLHGDDAQAIELYERLALQPAAHINSLMNLVVLYEDQGKYEEALECLHRVLAANPNLVRARLFLKDVESGRTMHIDEDRDDLIDTHTRQLETPISEFELSVRARNCLKKMNIHTLGDLLRTSETELLAYKNFGETSLAEIKVLLRKHEFDLGQASEVPSPPPPPAEVAPPPMLPAAHVPPESQAALSKPVSHLELSVRSRKCLQRLNISTIRDLISYSETELLAIRNFGQTSLIEIKGRLADIGVSLPGSSSE